MRAVRLIRLVSVSGCDISLLQKIQAPINDLEPCQQSAQADFNDLFVATFSKLRGFYIWGNSFFRKNRIWIIFFAFSHQHISILLTCVRYITRVMSTNVVFMGVIFSFACGKGRPFQPARAIGRWRSGRAASTVDFNPHGGRLVFNIRGRTPSGVAHRRGKRKNT